MSQQTVVTDSAGAPPEPPPSPSRSRSGGVSHARDYGRGFWIKVILVALIDAGAVYGILSASAVSQWGIVAFLVVVLVAVNWVYFSKRAMPGKYLFPGLVFLFVYV